jgi:subfamily B ATP-binding cassette protein MsbA
MTQPAPRAIPTPVGVLRHYARVAGVRPMHVVIPMVLVLISGAFEAASFSLLIPLTNAVSGDSFDFLADSPGFGWLAGLVPDSITDPTTRDSILVLITVGLIITGRVGKLIFEYVRKLYLVARTERYRVAVGEETFGRVLRFGRQYFDGHSIGRIDAEIGWSSSVLGLLTSAEELFRYLVGLVAKAVPMVALSPALAVAFLVTLPFVQWFMNSINKRVRRIAAEGIEVDRRVRSRILDILGSIPLVKAYSQEKTASDAYAEVLQEARDVAVRRDRVVSLRYPVEEVVILLVMLAVQGAMVYIAGDFTPGDLAAFGAFLVILQQALPDYKYMSMFGVRLAEEWPRLEAVAGLFSDEGKFIVPSGPRQFERLHEGIHVDNLTFYYQPGVDVLKDIDATIPAGKITAIVGRTGAGKTTLVDLVARFYDVAPGSIRLDDVDIREYALPSLHARMAIVSQDVWLLNRTIRENLTFGLARSVPDAELHAALEDVALHEFVAGLREGLDTEIGDRGVRLSGGQRQRLALARALLRDPDILILDEATSALDSLVEQRVARAIQQRAKGRTLIVIAHRLSTVRDADQILVMHDGRLVERGTWDELLARGGVFASLHEAQFRKDAAVTGPVTG